MMTRKDYIALARAFAQSQPTVADFTRTSPDGQNTFVNGIAHDAAYAAWSNAIRAVADVLEADNPRFDRLRFLYAGSK